MSRPAEKTTRFRAAVCVLSLTCTSSLAMASVADVIAATARQAADGTWAFEVTMRCDDSSAEYFCDRFEILTPGGRVAEVRGLPARGGN